MVNIEDTLMKNSLGIDPEKTLSGLDRAAQAMDMELDILAKHINNLGTRLERILIADSDIAAPSSPVEMDSGLAYVWMNQSDRLRNLTNILYSITNRIDL